MRVSLFLLVFAGCQSDTTRADGGYSTPAATDGLPTEADARAVAEALPYVQNGSVRILSLAKTNGQPFEVLGVPAYRMAVAVEWECVVPHGRMVEVDRMAALTCAHDDPAGARAVTDGVIDFEQTERGWAGSVPTLSWHRRANGVSREGSLAAPLGGGAAPQGVAPRITLPPAI